MVARSTDLRARLETVTAVPSNFSPDGSKVLVQSNRSGLAQLYVVSRDDGEMRQLTGEPLATASANRGVRRSSRPLSRSERRPLNQDHDASLYGAHLADGYDEIYNGVFDTDGAVHRLAALADGGPVLEFGVGTGRIALPLNARSLDVSGIDGSQEMLDQLAARPGGQDVKTVCGDFANTQIDGQFALVLLLVNTVYALPTQNARGMLRQSRTTPPAGRPVRGGSLGAGPASWRPAPGQGTPAGTRSGRTGHRGP